MHIINYKKQKNGKYLINNDSNLVLNDETILKFELLIKKEITDLDAVLAYDKAIDVYNMIVKKCAKTMLCTKDLDKMLNTSELKEEYKQIIKDKITKLGIINDDKYASSYVHDMLNLKNIGPRKIEANLLDLGISDSVIKKYLSEIDNEVWTSKINKLISKKIKANHTKNGLALKVAIGSYIFHEGYPKEMVMKEVNKYNFFDEELLVKDYQKIKKTLEKKYSNEELNNKIKYKLLSKGYSSENITKYFN